MLYPLCESIGLEDLFGGKAPSRTITSPTGPSSVGNASRAADGCKRYIPGSFQNNSRTAFPCCARSSTAWRRRTRPPLARLDAKVLQEVPV